MKQLPGLVELTCNDLTVLILTLCTMPPVVLYNITVAKPAERALKLHTLAGSSLKQQVCWLYVECIRMLAIGRIFGIHNDVGVFLQLLIYKLNTP